MGVGPWRIAVGASQPEIGQLGGLCLDVDQDVLWLEVTVTDSAVVTLEHSQYELLHQCSEQRWVHFGALWHILVDILFEVHVALLEHQVQLLFPWRDNVNQFDHVRVLDLS